MSCSLFYTNLVEISDLCLYFSLSMFAGFPNLGFIVITTFCSWNHFYGDHFEAHEHSSVLFHSDLVNQKAFPSLHTPTSEVPPHMLSVCGELSSWICTEALKPCLIFLKCLKIAPWKLKPGEHCFCEAS